MAKVLLFSVQPENPADDSWDRGAYTRLKESALLGQTSHTLVERPEEADIILFAELTPGNLAVRVRRHPFVKAYREKCFLYNTADLMIPFLPGIYPSIEKSWYNPTRTRSWSYLSILENPFIEYDPTAPEPQLLFSFRGSSKTAPTLRSNLGKISHLRGAYADTAGISLQVWTNGTSEAKSLLEGLRG
jgi:hypothetical protein